MPGRGPRPGGGRARDEKRRHEPLVSVSPDGAIRGPELPDTVDWPERTVLWWESWRTSPQAQTYTDTDWAFLLDTALLHAELWSGNVGVAAELRLRVAKFGATPEDRQRLRLEIVERSKATKRAPSAARRARVLQVVAEKPPC